MNKKLIRISLVVATAMVTISCSTVIGGFTSTAKSSGNGMGPATIAKGDTTLHNDKMSALTVINGNLTINQFVIKNQLNVSGNVTASKLSSDGVTNISGSLGATSSSFDGLCSVGNNATIANSYFGSNIEFAGTNLQLTDRSKVVGNIINTSRTPVTIIIDRSLVKGDIGFANSNSTVILQNRGHLKGKVINGKVQDLTGSDNYEGDDDLAESEVAIKK